VLAARVGHGVAAAVEARLGTVRQANASRERSLARNATARTHRRRRRTPKVVLPTSRTTPRGHRSGASDGVTAIDQSRVVAAVAMTTACTTNAQKSGSALASGESGGDRRNGSAPAAQSACDGARRRRARCGLRPTTPYTLVCFELSGSRQRPCITSGCRPAGRRSQAQDRRPAKSRAPCASSSGREVSPACRTGLHDLTAAARRA